MKGCCKVKEYSVERYKGNEYGIYALRSECFVLFGLKKELIERCKKLNEKERLIKNA